MSSARALLDVKTTQLDRSYNEVSTSRLSPIYSTSRICCKLEAATSVLTKIAKLANRNMTQGDWNNSAVEAYMEKGEEPDSTTLYAASKVLSERYLLDFVRDYQVPWDVVNILPTWVSQPIYLCLSFVYSQHCCVQVVGVRQFQ